MGLLTLCQDEQERAYEKIKKAMPGDRDPPSKSRIRNVKPGLTLMFSWHLTRLENGDTDTAICRFAGPFTFR
ncbi:hypothetical protein EIP91_002263 [Steccherinum ochraceum]|uniref:Uncharacterized protein n=1 Tax=Steccherinum ochraceum TaxID=92696 RepID=A0A4R0RT77_9APHY|nr:hypothetical protein EIP91_002263 [Steccherinum ochraceum]